MKRKIKKIKFTVYNKFHGTRAGIWLQATDNPDIFTVSCRTQARLQRRLCGIPNCKCRQQKLEELYIKNWRVIKKDKDGVIFLQFIKFTRKEK